MRKPSSWESEDLHRYLTTPQHLSSFVQTCRSHRKQHGKLLVSDDTSFVIEKLWFCVLMRRRDNAVYWKSGIYYVFQKTSCLQLIWQRTDCFMKYDAGLFLYKFLCRKEAKSICISSIISIFFPNTSLKIATHILCLSSLRFARLHHCWSCLEVFWRRLWFVSLPYQPGSNCSVLFLTLLSLWSFFKHHLTSWGRSDFYQQSFSLNLFLPLSFYLNLLGIFLHTKNVGVLT